MPAVRPGGIATTKLVTVLTGPHQGVQSQLLAFGGDGMLLALIDGHSLTARRTAAASVLAARAAGVTEVRTIAVLGAGRQARAQAEAYCACFDVQEVRVWARRREAAEAMAGELSGLAARATIAATAADAAMDADVITAATMATSPLLTSKDVWPGTHVDLVGGFRPGMREVDDALVARATVIADGPAALEEAGDLAKPLSTGNLRRTDIQFLGQILARPDSLVRRGDITLFKSVGHAAEDLVATELLLQRLTADEKAAA
jgi:ornithine cyclodeaminase